MATQATNEARLNFRLSPDLKTLIEEAAAVLGQSVSDYAVSTLVRNSRDVLQQTQVTKLSNRDRDLFIAMLDDTDAKPNKALSEAAKRYKKRIG
jgi:uncharacterized protein (DUF1778 family)